MVKITDVVIEPNKIYISNTFKIKIKIDGSYKYCDSLSVKYIDVKEKKYSDMVVR